MTTEQTSAASRRWVFPNAFDFIAMCAWVFISQYIAVIAATACGLQIPDITLLESPDDDISLISQLQMAQSLVIVYPVSMLLSVCGIIGYRLLRGGRGKLARFSAAGLDPALILGSFVWMIAAQIVIEPLLTLLPDVPNVVGRGFFAILVTVVLAPLFEEFLCRGIILESFRAKYGVTVAWIVSSLFFSAIHGQITSMVNALIIGSILGFVCIRSRSVLSSIILHSLNNCLALAAISFGLGDSTFSDIIPDRNTYIGIYVISAVVCLAGFVSLARRLAAERRREKYPVQE
ncbi:MAG: CPBP family intramembrane metalloprotease [Alistipes sp.]|nr:CPBP family intramembrane metalloprotease [Alistipes sp.]